MPNLQGSPWKISGLTPWGEDAGRTRENWEMMRARHC